MLLNITDDDGLTVLLYLIYNYDTVSKAWGDSEYTVVFASTILLWKNHLSQYCCNVLLSMEILDLIFSHYTIL